MTQSCFNKAQPRVMFVCWIFACHSETWPYTILVKTKVKRMENVGHQSGALSSVASNVLVIKNIGIVQKYPS